MNPVLKNILIAAVIIGVLFGVYKIFLEREPEEPLSSETAGNLPAEGGDLISLLLQLKSITLDTSLLEDPIFRTLENFTVNLAAEPVGRRNPFAPIGIEPRDEPAPATTTASGEDEPAADGEEDI